MPTSGDTPDPDLFAGVCDEVRNSVQSQSTRWRIQNAATHGANGYVFFGQNCITNQPVALKYYTWLGAAEHHREPTTLSRISHDNVLEIEHAEMVDGTWAMFVTRHLTNGDLDTLLSAGAPSLRRGIALCSDVIAGLSRIHHERLVHRDIKPANILLDDSSRAVIGDFGSVRALPDDSDEVPGSGHSILYRPPESFAYNLYGYPGDIYQCGILLYQLLGGTLSYDPLAWLKPQHLRTYSSMASPADQSIFVDQVIAQRIQNGRVITLSTLPPWVSTGLLRIMRKATHLDPCRRFPDCIAFLRQLHQVCQSVKDWRMEAGHPTAHMSDLSIRIVPIGTPRRWVLEQRRSSSWRRANATSRDDPRSLIELLEARFTS